jgi:hypothetical protein
MPDACATVEGAVLDQGAIAGVEVQGSAIERAVDNGGAVILSNKRLVRGSSRSPVTTLPASITAMVRRFTPFHRSLVDVTRRGKQQF